MTTPFLLALEDNIGSEWLKSITELVKSYGPYAFSILFIYSVSRWSHAKYREAVEKRLPARDIATHRGVFVGTCLAALALVVVSVWSWLAAQQITYLFKGVIVNLKDYEHLSSSELYRLELVHVRPDERAPQQRDEQFLVVRSAPFKSSDSFAIDFSKGDGKLDQFQLTYTSDENPKYLIVFDESVHKNVLKRLPSTQINTQLLDSFGLENTLAAASFTMHRAAGTKAADASSIENDGESAWIETLQNPRSTVGAKINALTSLTKQGISDRLLLQPTGQEPLAITLIDLERHSDSELAFVAKTAVRDSHVQSLVTRLLASSNRSERATGESILFRMDKTDALETLSGLQTTDNEKARLTNEVNRGDRTKALKATATAQGDRYYVQADWKPGDAAAADCLARLFNDSLINNRTMQQEQRLMAGRGQRIVYWYDKSWALEIANRINECGAHATFIAPK